MPSNIDLTAFFSQSRKSAGSDVYATAAEYMKQLSIKCEESGESGSTSADKKNTSSPDDQVPAWFGKAYDTVSRELFFQFDYNQFYI